MTTSRSQTPDAQERLDEGKAVLVVAGAGGRLAGVPTDDDSRWTPRVLDAPGAVEHVRTGGRLAIRPVTIGLCVVTVDRGKSPIANDELHDAVPQDPACVTVSPEGGWQVWYRRPAGPVREGRWKHGHVICERGWVSPGSWRRIAMALKRTDRTMHAAELECLPGPIH